TSSKSVWGSHDSPLEQAGFEPAVPRWFRSWPGRPGNDLDQREGEPLPSRGGTNGSNPLSSSGESGELPTRFGPNLRPRSTPTRSTGTFAPAAIRTTDIADRRNQTTRHCIVRRVLRAGV